MNPYEQQMLSSESEQSLSDMVWIGPPTAKRQRDTSADEVQNAKRFHAVVTPTSQNAVPATIPVPQPVFSNLPAHGPVSTTNRVSRDIDRELYKYYYGYC